MPSSSGFYYSVFRTANLLDSVLILTKALNTPLLISFEDKKETNFSFTFPSPPGMRGAGCGVRGTSTGNKKNKNLDTKANLNPNPTGNFVSNSLFNFVPISHFLVLRTRSLSPVPRPPSPVPYLMSIGNIHSVPVY